MRSFDRRDFLHLAGAYGLAIGASSCKRGEVATVTDAGANNFFHEKARDLIIQTDRPPNLETPLKYFREDLTPNEAFFVRWHVSVLPDVVDLRTYRLAIDGHVDQPLSLSLDDLKRMPATSLVAVNQCSGNGRSAFEPRVPGVQWGNGALGNARWTGVPLKALLDRAGVKAGARDVTFAGLDRGPLPSIPNFVKSISTDLARSDDVLVAYAMNDAPLPMLNGFPLRLVVPGYYSTYWVKALERIRVLDSEFDGFWMKKAYRIPKTANAAETPSALATETTPIAKMNVRSLLVTPEPGAALRVGAPCPIEGIAFDGGSGIARVDVSTDGGATWTETTLDRDLGRYSFRRFRTRWVPQAPGEARLLVRATGTSGETQGATPIWNRAGYMRNVIESTTVQVTA